MRHIQRIVLLLAIASLIAIPLSCARAAQRTDSLICLTDHTLRQDSTEATTDVMVPFRSELVKAAHRHQVPAALLAAFCQEESGWQPWAERSEPGYLKNKKIKKAAAAWAKEHRGLPTALTELNARSRSMGLMQPMGELAREQGFDSTYLSSLFEPFNSIDQGATLLKSLLQRYGKDTMSAISAYNQGNNRKKHGQFENARYVYRVSVAWEHYKSALRYGTNHIQSAPRPQMARMDRSNTFDSCGPARDSARPSDLDDTNHQNYVKNGLGAFGLRYDSRHDPPGPTGSGSISEQPLGRYADPGAVARDTAGLYVLLAFIGLLGFAYIARGLALYYTGHTPGVLQHPDRHLPGTFGHGQPSPYSS